MLLLFIYADADVMLLFIFFTSILIKSRKVETSLGQFISSFGDRFEKYLPIFVPRFFKFTFFMYHQYGHFNFLLITNKKNIVIFKANWSNRNWISRAVKSQVFPLSSRLLIDILNEFDKNKWLILHLRGPKKSYLAYLIVIRRNARETYTHTKFIVR